MSPDRPAPSRERRRAGPPSSLRREPVDNEPEAFRAEFPHGNPWANQAMRNIVRLGDVLVDAVNRRLRMHGLHLATAQALSVLEGAEHPLTPNQIGAHLHLTSGTVTTVIDSLENRGLVQRHPHPEDRRKILVSITDTGRAVVDRYLPEAVAIQTAMLAGLDDEELRSLNELLTRALRSTIGVDPHTVAESAPPRRRPRRRRAAAAGERVGSPPDH